MKLCRKILAACLLLLTFSAASVVAAPSVTGGFNTIKQELGINPCLSDKVVTHLYGSSARSLSALERQKWPSALCQNPVIAQNLVNWNISSTALMANTERPTLIAGLIAERNNELYKCPDVECMNRLLPRMLEWSRINLDRTPVNNPDFRPQPVLGGLLLYPKISLRGLQTPLPGQESACGTNVEQVLKFYSSNIQVTGSAIVLADCLNADQVQSVWLLENTNKSPHWNRILFYQGNTALYILPNNRERHPTLYTKSPSPVGDVVTVYDYVKPHGYQRTVSYIAVADEFGLLHAFETTIY